MTATAHDPLSTEEIRAAVADALPDADADLLAATPIDHGKNAVYRVTVAAETEREFVLKVGTRSDSPSLRTEPRVLELVADETDIPVPTVRGAGDAGDPLDYPYFLMDAEPGANFECSPDALPGDTFERVCAEAGRHLADLHANLRFDAFGPLALDDGDLRVTRTFEWPDLFETATDSTIDRLDGTRFEAWIPALRDHLRRAVRDLDLDGEFDPVLVHHDYRLGNLLIDADADADAPRATTAVLDWAAPTTAHAEYELAVTEALLINWPSLSAARRDACRERLYAGYRQVRDRSRDDGFERRRRLYRFAARVRLLANIHEELPDADQSALDSRAADHRAFLSRYVDLPGDA